MCRNKNLPPAGENGPAAKKKRGLSMEKEMLKGKVAVITGASYGMGRTMAELFAEEGAAVVLTARGQEKLDQVVQGIRAKGGRAVGLPPTCAPRRIPSGCLRPPWGSSAMWTSSSITRASGSRR